MIKLSESFCELVDALVVDYVEQQSSIATALNANGRSIDEMVLTHLVENAFIDHEFGDEIFDLNGELDEEADGQVQNVVREYIKSKLKQGDAHG